MRDAQQRGWQLLCTDLETAVEPSEVRVWRNRGLTVVLGDLRDVAFARRIVCDEMQQLDAIVHFAAVVPPDSEGDDKLSYESNVIATVRLLRAAKELEYQPFFVFSSTFNVYGIPLSNHSIKSAEDPAQPVGNYATHKAEAEELVQASDIPWVIARVGVVLDAGVTSRASRSMMSMAFEMAPDLPSECIHTSDVTRAMLNMVERQAACVGKILLIGGGESCRVSHYDQMNLYFEAAGLRLAPTAFGGDRHPCHWLDTRESQQLLEYQQHSYADICQEAQHRFRRIRPLLRLFAFILNPVLAWYIRRFVRQTSWL